MNPALEPAVVFQHCPRCGAAALRPQRSMGFTCAGCGFVFFLNVAAAVAAVIRDEAGRVLLTRRAHDPAKGTLDIPGGFVDHDETAEAALRREILEELNLELDDLAYFCTVTNVYEYAGLNYRTLDVYFTGRPRDLSRLRAADDVDGYAFVDLATLPPEEIGLDSVRQALARLRPH